MSKPKMFATVDDWKGSFWASATTSSHGHQTISVEIILGSARLKKPGPAPTSTENAIVLAEGKDSGKKFLLVNAAQHRFLFPDAAMPAEILLRLKIYPHCLLRVQAAGRLRVFSRTLT